MGLIFNLHNNDLASYRWDSLIAHYSPFAHVNTRTLPETLASSAAGVANWTTEAEFRKTVAFMHESIHYLQDVLTGVGYWDYLILREKMRGILTGAMHLSWLPKLSPPFKTPDDPELVSLFQESQAAATTAAESLLFVPRHYLPQARFNQIVKTLATALKVPQASSDELRPLLLDGLLETEAMLSVYSEIQNLKAGNEQWDIAEQNKGFWHFQKMQPEYSETFELFFAAITPADVTPEQIPKFLSSAVILLPFFITLACAHPSPRLLSKHGASQSDYYPGIKLARLVRAFMDFSLDEDMKFVDAITKGETRNAEELLLKQCEFRYLSSEEVYDDWLDIFTLLAANDDDRVLRIRKQCCEIAATKPAECARKRLYLVVTEKIPLYYYTREGIQSYGFSYEHFDPKEKEMYFADLMRHNRDLALAEYFFESGKFICPLAEGNVCHAVTPVCLSGITEMSSLPASEECLVRRGLKKAGFNLRDRG